MGDETVIVNTADGPGEADGACVFVLVRVGVSSGVGVRVKPGEEVNLLSAGLETPPLGSLAEAVDKIAIRFERTKVGLLASISEIHLV